MALLGPIAYKLARAPSEVAATAGCLTLAGWGIGLAFPDIGIPEPAGEDYGSTTEFMEALKEDP
ncbi:unnamed protein product, partial [marine sediment metagenome]